MNQDAPINGILTALGNPGTAVLALGAGVKLAFLFAIGLYIIFALVILRQISLMNRTVHTSITPLLKLIGYAHFAAAIFVWLVAFILL